MTTLENLYFGNITPNDQIVKSGTALKRPWNSRRSAREKLTRSAGGQRKNIAAPAHQRGERGRQYHGTGKFYPRDSVWEYA